jgi:hypothetical protein
MVNPQGVVKTATLPPPSDSTTPGVWFVGATPPNADPNKHPIVFVQGMNGRAQDWWGETAYHGVNDMYETAYHYGYRTAFVQLYDAAGNGSASQWDNGRLLALMLQQIYAYFGQKVNIVAHSKGGLDTQAALIHYEAWPYVERVVTLASPHYGSNLADLTYSWYAGWLADLIGQQSPGMYSLQTGEMAKYRELTDSHPNVGKNVYYTSAGTSWGPFPSTLWTGGLYLSPYGSNDGLVNEWSTHLPYAQHLFTINVDHDQIRMGSTSFARIEPVLRSSASLTTGVRVASDSTPEVLQPSDPEQVVKGEPLASGQTVTEVIPVGAGTKEAVFTPFTRSPLVRVKLVSPSGKTVNRSGRTYFKFKVKDRDFFNGASVQGCRLANPQSGTWKVVIPARKSKKTRCWPVSPEPKR